MPKAEYDFLAWTSFPSSAKIVNETERWLRFGRDIPSLRNLSVKPGSKLRVELNVKQEGVTIPNRMSHLSLNAAPPPEVGESTRLGAIEIPIGTFDWRTFTEEITVPPGVGAIYGYIAGGAMGTSWYDDLKIYQDGVLIYSNDFAKWDPVIGAGLGAGVLGVVVPAVVRVPEPGIAYEYQKPVLEKEPLWAAGLAGLGALVGGGLGLLTALGIVPVPQIPPLPALEAPPEGARLGTYVVHG